MLTGNLIHDYDHDYGIQSTKRYHGRSPSHVRGGRGMWGGDGGFGRVVILQFKGGVTEGGGGEGWNILC